MRNIVEDFDPSINVEGGSIDINDEAVVDAINRNLSAVTADSGVTPYVKLEKIRKILAYYKIFIPHTVFLEGDEGNEVFEISQFGEKSGVTNDAEFKEKKSDGLYLYFEWMTNDDGLVDVFSEIVDEDDLEEILADYEDESEEDDEEDSDGAEVSYDAYKASNMAEETQLDELSKDLMKEDKKKENKIQHHETSIAAIRDKIDKRIKSGDRGIGGYGYNDSDEKELAYHKKQLRKLKLSEEQLDELSKDFVARVAKAAIADSNRGTGRNQGGPTGSERWHNKRRQKLAGKAIDKLSGNAKVPANEETQLDEATEKRKELLKRYIKAASHDVAARSAAVRGFARDADDQRKSGQAMDARRSDARADKMFKKSWNRRQYMAKAVDKLTSEETFAIKGHKDEDDGKHLYWSNKDGWVTKGSHTKFSSKEKEKVNLPIGGKWVKHKK